MNKFLKKLIGVLLISILITFSAFSLSACDKNKEHTIGVSFGVGGAERWVSEKKYMEEYADEHNIKLDIRFNTNANDLPRSQYEDCVELIDSGIKVLVLIPRDASKAKDILDYAKKHNVKVISYARVVLGEKVDLFVGYDSARIGQTMGKYLSQKVYSGDYLILSGDPGDNNAKLLYDGAMSEVNKIKKDINIIGDEAVVGWSYDEAKRIVIEKVSQNDNKVDAILAPNDKIAGACRSALDELGITAPVEITGMDAELDAIQRVAKGTQSITIFMNLKSLAHKAIEQAYKIAQGKKPEVNNKFDNKSGGTIDANLIYGELITKENIQRLLIDTNHFTREQIYGDD